jgi:hypothetical protein
VEGMTEFLPRNKNYTRRFLMAKGVVGAVHMWPVESFSHLIDVAGSCLCGPQVDHVEFDHGMVPEYLHQPLHPLWYDEGWSGYEDGGDDDDDDPGPSGDGDPDLDPGMELALPGVDRSGGG